MLNRRALFRTASILPIGYVVGCSQLQTVANDATIIANGVAAILPTIQAIVGLPASIVAKVQDGIAVLKSAASSLGSAITGGASTAGQQLAAGLAAVTGALQGITIPSWVTTVLSAAQTLLPVALQLAGVILAGPAPDPKAVAQARAILTAAAVS